MLVYLGLSAEEVEEFLLNDEEPEYDDQSLRSNCEDCLESFAALNPKQTMTIVVNLLEQSIQQNDVQMITAACNALLMVADQTEHVTKAKDILQITQCLLKLLGHENPAVRFNVVDTFGEIFTQYAPKIQKLHQMLMPPMM